MKAKVDFRDFERFHPNLWRCAAIRRRSASVKILGASKKINLGATGNCARLVAIHHPRCIFHPGIPFIAEEKLKEAKEEALAALSS